MVDEARIRELLTSMLEEIADKAKADAVAGESDIGSIWRDNSTPKLPSLDLAKVQQAIQDINKVTATKEAARLFVDALMVTARIAARTLLS